MIDYDFTKTASKEFFKTPKAVQQRIIKKLEFYLAQPDPLSFADKLITSQPTYRFRIGDYRVIFDWEKTGIIILRVGHRREVYR